MESDKEDDVVFLDRASRATRGKRMTKLVDDEIEEDDEFWNQDALKDEEDDTNYVEEGEAADDFDSDFDSDEPEPEEEADNEPDERRTRKKLVYPGKPKPSFQAKPKPGFPGKPRLGFPGKEIPKKKQKKVVSETDTSNGEDTNPEQSKSTPQDDHDEPDDNEVEKTTRKSTRTAVVVRQAERAERDATRAALQATMKPIKRKKEGEEKKITQEEMLLEAAQTEIMNLRNLERVLAREEEVKKRAIVHKAVYTGPQIRYLSKDGNSYLEFTNGVSFKSQIPTRSTPYPEKDVCVVTGLPAKYRDPKTGLPYATKEAFKIIRERHASNSSGIKEKNSMGMLYDLTSQEGFAKKKRRSINPNMRENSYLRSSARFRQIPAFEDLDSD
ncbi:sequence-specific DNA binding transcription factor [Artemisia annua]|uniref:Sequence-specific DNA binding transcription factor n=1 Tax=Artemisia annua TaxID=35608 RepID=A0A2U1Q075_ARTAN|nr:sequence-specific DNA binding transcription factor [Artemisia annua]